jgi:cell wall-associated NlpC family hydrolase
MIAQEGWMGQRCHRAAAGLVRLAVVAMVTVSMASTLPSSTLASSTVASSTAPPGAVRASQGPPKEARQLARARAAELARAAARTATLATVLTALRTQQEILTERYDREAELAGQAAAGYRGTLARLTAARSAERADSLRLARLAAAEYEADGGQGMAFALLAQTGDPQAYLRVLGAQQVMDGQRADLVAASRADEIVYRLFARQAAGLLAQQRAASQAADELRLAVAAAVSHQGGVLTRARASRARLAAELASARAGEASAAAPQGTSPPGATGASPGVTAPDWAPSAGASTAQGGAAANWALTQLGKPYQWGGAGLGSYDCSGLAMDAWARAGVRLYHWTGFQWVSGPHVPLSQLRRGDLVFYATNVANAATIHHVGIYLGDDLMVDAPYTGAVVRVDSIHAYAGLIGATRPAA